MNRARDDPINTSELPREPVIEHVVGRARNFISRLTKKHATARSTTSLPSEPLIESPINRLAHMVETKKPPTSGSNSRDDAQIVVIFGEEAGTSSLQERITDDAANHTPVLMTTVNEEYTTTNLTPGTDSFVAPPRMSVP